MILKDVWLVMRQCSGKSHQRHVYARLGTLTTTPTPYAKNVISHVPHVLPSHNALLAIPPSNVSPILPQENTFVCALNATIPSQTNSSAWDVTWPVSAAVVLTVITVCPVMLPNFVSFQLIANAFVRLDTFRLYQFRSYVKVAIIHVQHVIMREVVWRVVL